MTSKTRPLQEQVREASLDSIAASLASIHLAKQMRARERVARGGGASAALQDVRIPVHDLIHGLAQLQVEFVQRLLSFNKDATSRIQSALLAADVESSAPIEVQATSKGCAAFDFTIVNRATTTRLLELEDRGPGKLVFTPSARITLPAGGRASVKATCTGLGPDVYRGCISVESRRIRVHLVHYVITVT